MSNDEQASVWETFFFFHREWAKKEEWEENNSWRDFSAKALLQSHTCPPLNHNTVRNCCPSLEIWTHSRESVGPLFRKKLSQPLSDSLEILSVPQRVTTQLVSSESCSSLCSAGRFKIQTCSRPFLLNEIFLFAGPAWAQTGNLWISVLFQNVQKYPEGTSKRVNESPTSLYIRHQTEYYRSFGGNND